MFVIYSKFLERHPSLAKCFPYQIGWMHFSLMAFFYNSTFTSFFNDHGFYSELWDKGSKLNPHSPQR